MGVDLSSPLHTLLPQPSTLHTHPSTCNAGSQSSFLVSDKAMHRLVPSLSRTGFSVEAWGLVTGGNGIPRILASCGRFELGINRFNTWTMTVFLKFKDKPVVGACAGVPAWTVK
jgi:hypothetical protein